LPKEIVIETYRPNPTPAKFHGSTAKHRFLTGPMGSGKSRSGIEEVAKQMRKYPGNVFYVLRNTYPELKDSTIPDFQRYWPPELLRVPNRWDKSYNQVDHNLKVCQAGMVKFRSADRPEKFWSIDDMGGFMLVEAPDIPEDTFLVLSSRPRRKDIPITIIFEGYPPSDQSWVYRLFWLLQDPDYQRFEIPKEENMHNLRPDYYEDLYKQYGHKPNWVARYIDGKVVFLSAGNPICAMFDERIHVIPEGLRYDPAQPLLIGFDYGYHYPAVVFLQFRPEIDQFWVLGSFFLYNHVAPLFASKVHDRMFEWFAAGGKEINHKDHGDPAGEFASDKKMKTPEGKEQKNNQPATTVQDFNKFGFHPTSKHSFVGEGVNLVRKYLMVREDGRPGMLIDGSPGRNEVLIRALLGGWCTKKDSEDPDTTAHPYIDLMDALRYVLVNCGIATFEKVSKETRVYQYENPNQVLNKYARAAG
jgi:hypothetical protein